MLALPITRYCQHMRTTPSKLTRKYQAAIPEPVRARLQLKGGDSIAFGLPAASVVRMKLFTLDQEFVLRKAGTLALRDRKAAGRALRKLFAGALPGASE